LNTVLFVDVWNNIVQEASNLEPPIEMTETIDIEQERQIQEDIQLIQRIAERDSVAFQMFYKKYSGLIFAAISNVLNDHHDTEDVMQEVLVQLWNKAHLYEPRKGKPLTWLTTMARNRAIDRIRSKQRRSRLNDDFESENKKLQFEFEESGLEILEEKERDSIVHRAVSKLNDDQREAIHLAYFSGLTQAEVAERLNEPLGTIKARIRRGVSRLEALVKPRIA
jgi:RNA polymerase sigma-70 factor (ECF subfamily)